MRVVHDGSCSYLEEFPLNRKIKVRDQVGAAGARDLKRTLRAQAESKKAVFGIKVDVADAHRVIRVHEDDWPLLACQVRNRVYLNLVGAFGVASAGYWWDRLAAALGRLSHHAFDSLSDVWLFVEVLFVKN